ncbi:MAG TPA: hypothetical protein VN682_09785 [Terriglobales bacterium]|nr:hypothetical protein [Terriglobales bacterium]
MIYSFLYRLALRLYPRHHREIFQKEMLAVLAAAWADVSAEPVLSRIRFAMRESIGLIAGAVIEHRRLVNERRETSLREIRRFSRGLIYGMASLFCVVLGAIASCTLVALHAAPPSQPLLHASMYALPAIIPMLLVAYVIGGVISLAASQLRLRH